MTSGPLCALPELMSGPPLRHPIHVSLCVPGSVKRSPHVGCELSRHECASVSPGDCLARLRQPKEAKAPHMPTEPRV